MISGHALFFRSLIGESMLSCLADVLPWIKIIDFHFRLSSQYHGFHVSLPIYKEGKPYPTPLFPLEQRLSRGHPECNTNKKKRKY